MRVRVGAKEREHWCGVPHDCSSEIVPRAIKLGSAGRTSADLKLVLMTVSLSCTRTALPNEAADPVA